VTGDRRFVHELGEHHVEQLHALYQGEWWSNGRSLEDTRRCVAGSLCFAMVDAHDHIIAFARVVTDFVFKAFVFDVIVAPAHRGQSLGDAIIEHLLQHERLRGVRHVELYCLPEMFPYYRRHGFTEAVGAVRLMRRAIPN
jgi:GNAT superfamily N-acetyltransferase